MLSVVNLNVELVLNCVVDHDASLQVKVILLVIPVSLVSDWHSIPSLWVDVAQSVSTTLDDSLCKHMRLLSQMQVVLVWVVKRPDGTHIDQ